MDEARHDPKRGFSRRLRDGNVVPRPAVHGRLPRSGRLGPRVSRQRIDGYANMAGMWLVGEDLPQETNRVTLTLSLASIPVANITVCEGQFDANQRGRSVGQAWRDGSPKCMAAIEPRAI